MRRILYGIRYVTFLSSDGLHGRILILESFFFLFFFLCFFILNTRLFRVLICLCCIAHWSTVGRMKVQNGSDEITQEKGEYLPTAV